MRPDFLPREQESFRSGDDDWAGQKVRASSDGRWGSQLHFLDDDRYQDEAYVKVGHWTFVKVSIGLLNMQALLAAPSHFPLPPSVAGMSSLTFTGSLPNLAHPQIYPSASGMLSARLKGSGLDTFSM